MGSSEPVVERWTPIEAKALLECLGLEHSHLREGGRPLVVAVDGRSGAGKSTLARRLAAAVPDTAVVATDDIAWHFSMFDWSAALISYVIEPVVRGEAVAYRPPGWIAKNRPGAVTVAPSRTMLVIEGVGSSQRALAGSIDAAIWVQSDADSARELGIARDIASAVNGDPAASIRFWDDWASAEEPFLEREAPWSRADVMVAGVAGAYGAANSSASDSGNISSVLSISRVVPIRAATTASPGPV